MHEEDGRTCLQQRGSEMKGLLTIKTKFGVLKMLSSRKSGDE
jgi:hypothetical protein